MISKNTASTRTSVEEPSPYCNSELSQSLVFSECFVHREIFEDGPHLKNYLFPGHLKEKRSPHPTGELLLNPL
jgi:hypothetical protein